MTEFQTFAEAVKAIGIVSYGTAYRRVKEMGWTPEQAISTPPFNDPNMPFLVGKEIRGTRLTLVKKDERQPGQKDVKWTCKCRCGNYVSVAKKNLLSGRTKSCGCWKRERLSAIQRDKQQRA